MRAILPIAVAVILSFALDATLFRTGWYATILEPDSAAGTFEGLIHGELGRKLEGHRNALVLGDSRMAEGFSTKAANELSGETGWHFYNVGTPGSTPRCWYYLVRGVDPTATRYQAILAPVDDYNDRDVYEDIPNRLADLHFVVNRVTLPDVPDFVASFPSPQARMHAALGTIWRGITYQPDFQAYLTDRTRREERAALVRAHAIDYWDDYDGIDKTMAGLSVDWSGKKILTGTLTPEYKQMVEEDLFASPPQIGRTTPYRRLWLGRIIRYYAATGARIVFFREPQTPLTRPDSSPPNTSTFIREASANGSVIVLDEHLFDNLQRPELFADPKHLNRTGRHLFSPALAREAARRLN